MNDKIQEKINLTLETANFFATKCDDIYSKYKKMKKEKQVLESQELEELSKQHDICLNRFQMAKAEFESLIES